MDKIEDLLVNKGLYDAVDISVEDLNEMQKYLSKSEYTNNNIYPELFTEHLNDARKLKS